MTFETLLLIVFALNNSSFCASHVVALNFLLRILLLQHLETVFLSCISIE